LRYAYKGYRSIQFTDRSLTNQRYNWILVIANELYRT
jgi:hypothetical protein